MAMTLPFLRAPIATAGTAFLLVVCGTSVRAQKTELPFAPGERLEYTGRAHPGVSARGTMRVDGPSDLRGTLTWTLHSDMEGKFGFLRGSDRSVSWIDPARMTALRYTARERNPLAKHDEAVDIVSVLPNDTPLDELSFLYYVRTLPLADGMRSVVSRHFDPARNPTTLAVVGREEIEVGAGVFSAVVVEMRVRDARRYRGEGVIRIHLSDDKCRLILRLESKVPEAGTATLALAAYSGTRWTCSAKLR